jgi:hypothetical protein
MITDRESATIACIPLAAGLAMKEQYTKQAKLKSNLPPTPTEDHWHTDHGPPTTTDPHCGSSIYAVC